MDLRGAQRGMLQAFTQMSEVSFWTSDGCHALVYLENKHIAPRDFLGGQRAQHPPWSLAAAQSQCEAAASGDRRPRFCSNNFSRLFGNLTGIAKHVNLHGISRGTRHKNAVALRDYLQDKMRRGTSERKAYASGKYSAFRCVGGVRRDRRSRIQADLPGSSGTGVASQFENTDHRRCKVE